MRILSRTLTATDDPVTTAALADHLRIETAEATAAMRYARTAAREIEAYADLALQAQTIEVEFDATEAGALLLSLPIGPVDSITSVEGADGEALAHTVSGGHRPTITLDSDPGSTVTVTYEAGFATIPDDLVHAVLDHALRLFDLRGDVDESPRLAPSAARIAARYRRVRLSA